MSRKIFTLCLFNVAFFTKQVINDNNNSKNKKIIDKFFFILIRLEIMLERKILREIQMMIFMLTLT
jgi:hypothetical protein